MTSLNKTELQGIADFLNFYQNDGLSQTLAKVVCKNLLMPAEHSAAVQMVLLHSPSSLSILNRKAITKTYLFKYLNDRKVAVNVEYSKQLLIDKIIQYWTDTYSEEEIPHPITRQTEHIHHEIVENFPVHQMSRKFANWFFDMYNGDQLKIDDFWCDVNCDIDLTDNNMTSQQESMNGNQYVLDLLTTVKRRFDFYYNPNVCHTGVQGRIDPHGMVLVLCCGTLHSQERCVGVFECAFGLVRDPFTDNNWKIKHMRLRLKSSVVTQGYQPSLQQCESLQMMLTLPDTSEDIEFD